jgi:hypothetical protein
MGTRLAVAISIQFSARRLIELKRPAGVLRALPGLALLKPGSVRPAVVMIVWRPGEGGSIRQPAGLLDGVSSVVPVNPPRTWFLLNSHW